MNDQAHRIRLTQFFAYVPRRYQAGLVVITALTGSIGILDSLGLALVVPLVETIVDTGSLGADNLLVKWAAEFFSWFGIALTFGWIIALILMVQIVRSILLFFQSWLTTLFRARYEAYLKTLTYRAFFNAGWPFFFGQKTGDMVNTIARQASQGGHVMGALSAGIAAAVTIAIYFAASLAISWQLSLAALGGTMLIILVLSFLVSRARRLGEQVSEAASGLVVEATDSLGGAKVIKSGALEEQVLSRFTSIVKKYADGEGLIGMNQGLLLALSEFFFICVLVGGIVLAARGLAMPAGSLLLFALLFFRIFQRAKALQMSAQGLNEMLPGLDAVVRALKQAGDMSERTGGKAFSALKKGVRLQDVTFGYSQRAPVLLGVTISIPRGSVVGVVGPSGVGKTTVVDLVTGLLDPTSGNVLIDDQPLTELDVRSWRRRIAYVSQGALLFNDTVAANISMGLPGVSRQDVEQAVRLAEADEFVRALPEGYDTVVGERGVLLSGGQRQRIALARAFARKPEFLILDEATSELDSSTEISVQHALEQVRGKLTMLIVAHRLSTVMSADAIFVLQGGRIAESGTPQELLSKRGVFFEMYSPATAQQSPTP